MKPACAGNPAGLDKPEENGPSQARTCCGRRHSGLARGALVEPAALAVLLTGTSHGYDLRRAVLELTSGTLEIDAGGLYRVLRRFEDEGFAVSSWDETSNGPRRRDYGITETGRELASDWIEHLRERERLAGVLASLLENGLADHDGTPRKGYAHE
jgi:DNA-binding PadR family transcriptional regulator